jgi:type I restriction enzyme S subunit
LGDLLDFSNGINADKSAYGSGTPFINVLEVITSESLTEEDIPGLVTLPPKVLARYRVSRGDVLLNRTSETQEEVGLTSVYLGDQPVVFGGFVFRGRPKTSEMDLNYAKYALRAADVRSQIIARGQGGIRANVGQGDLKTVVVCVPDLPEQRAIAEALDDASALVAALERVIAKKRLVKLGMVQELLTARTRLPGFTDVWATRRLGDHAAFVHSVALSRAQLDNFSPLRYLHYGDIHTRESVVLDAGSDPMPRAALGLARRAGRLQIGDVVFADASEDADGVGKSVEITGVPTEGVVPGLHTIAVRFDKAVLADGFKAYLQFIPSFRTSLLRLASGTKVLATTKGYIAGVELELPDVAEQQAIAQVLTSVDGELEALERRLRVTRDLRQGMIQQLLSGHTRLSVEEMVA